MTLTVPNLDDRRFQDLVDDAKRLVQQRCPEWSDHNVSDPGVTLIELFAWMTDQLLYRLNRVPDRNYIKFLELIGVKLFPPAAARTPVTFWLSAPRPDTVTIPTATEVATQRTDTQEAIVFSTIEDLDIVSVEMTRVASRPAGKTVKDHTDELSIRSGFFCFDSPPKPGNELLIGLSKAAPSNVINLGFECRIEGVGVDPTFPPLVWEAWTATGWVECELQSDTTGGLNKDGSVLLHVPRGHTSSVINQVTAGWLRAMVTTAVEGQPQYSASPEILGLTAFSIGGTADTMNAELITNEVLGTSEGVAGQRFQLLHAPVVAGEKPLEVEISEGPEGWQVWSERPNFAASGPTDKHFVLDAVSGEIQLGLAVRLADGVLRSYGAVPEKGSYVRVPQYRSGGGAKGNVAPRTLNILKASIPYIESVENRKPATGGVDGESLEAAKVRGPILLRTRDRAVTAEDYEHICREAAPEVARVRCLTGDDGAEAGVVKVLLVPAVPTDTSRLPFESLVPADETLERVTRRLDESRVIGTRIMVEPPVYRGVTIVAKLRARPRTDPRRLQDQALDALFKYFHPTIGGPEGTGWPFGRPVVSGEVFSTLQALRGTEMVDEVRIFGADPVTGERGKATDRLEVEPSALVFSYDHQVLVEGLA
jgi:predicted phage baseplate assembly protein